MGVTGRLDLRVQALINNALDLGSQQALSIFSFLLDLADGVGLNQINEVWSDERTLVQGTTEDLDLSGTALQNGVGQNIALARVKLIAFLSLATNTFNLQIGGAATNAMANIFNALTDKLNIRPGGGVVLWAPDATGYVVTATTADLLRITAAAGSGSAIYRILVAGGKT